MGKIEYHVISHYSHSEFVNLVNQFLEQGWKLQGGVSIGKGDMSGIHYAQAIIKEINTK